MYKVLTSPKKLKWQWQVLSAPRGTALGKNTTYINSFNGTLGANLDSTFTGSGLQVVQLSATSCAGLYTSSPRVTTTIGVANGATLGISYTVSSSTYSFVRQESMAGCYRVSATTFAARERVERSRLHHAAPSTRAAAHSAHTLGSQQISPAFTRLLCLPCPLHTQVRLWHNGFPAAQAILQVA